jgi:hypothetical protein
MKKLLVIVVLGLLWCSVGIAEKYPKIKDPVKSISGSIKKLKIPGKVNLKDYNVKNPGSKIYIDVVKRRLELKDIKIIIDYVSHLKVMNYFLQCQKLVVINGNKKVQVR